MPPKRSLSTMSRCRAIVRLEQALEPDAPLIHEDLDANLNARVRQQKGDYAAAAAAAHRVIHKRFFYDRGTAAALENRGIVVDWDTRDEFLTMWTRRRRPSRFATGWRPCWGSRKSRSASSPPSSAAAFGPRIMMLPRGSAAALDFHPAQPAGEVDRGSPGEFLRHHPGARRLHEAEIAVDAEGKIVGIKDFFLHDAGAYAPYGLTVPINSQCTLLGQCVVPNYDSEFFAVYTTSPSSPPTGAPAANMAFL